MTDANDRAPASAAAVSGKDGWDGAVAPPAEDEHSELERLRAENAELRQKMAARGGQRRAGWRAPVSIVLIVLGCILAPVAVLGTWPATRCPTPAGGSPPSSR